MSLLLVLDIMCNMAELQTREDKKIADAIIEKEYDREYKDIQIPKYAMEDTLDFFDIKDRSRADYGTIGSTEGNLTREVADVIIEKTHHIEIKITCYRAEYETIRSTNDKVVWKEIRKMFL